MSNEDSSESPTEQEEKEPSSKLEGGWRPVDRRIWTPSTEMRNSFFRALFQRIIRTISSLPPLVVAVPALLVVPLTFGLAYYLGGGRLFGPALAGIWAFLIVLGVVIVEKTGYSRNYEGWDFPLRKIIFLPVAFLIAIGWFYFIVILGGLFR